MAAACGVAVALASGIAAADPVRLLVAVGSQAGLPAERALRFSHADASRVRDVMVAQGGVKASDAIVLAEPTREALVAALATARDRARAHAADEVTFVFYFSGHGDRDALHVGGERFLLADLDARLRDVPAALRIVVTDACRATRDKGFAAEAAFPIALMATEQARGSVWLHASSDGEAAQESDEVEGAIFTHAWLSGLRGAADANGDARVTLEESFAFAHSQTLIRSAKSSGVMQKPEAVMTLREAAPVVLTQASLRLATLVLPAARDAHFLVYAKGAKSVVAELWGAAERRTALALPPGRYVVQRRVAATGAAAHIAMDAGEQRAVQEKDFAPESLETLAQKGGELERAPRHELIAGYEVGGSARAGVYHGPRVGYAYVLPGTPAIALAAAGSVEMSQDRAARNPEELRAGYAHLAIEPRLPLGPVTLRAGVGGRAGVVVQSLERRALPGALDPTATTRETSSAFAGGPEAYVGARLSPRATPGGFFVDLGATGNVLLFRQEGATRAVLGGAAVGSVGTAF